MTKLLALEPEETLRTGEVYIGSIQFRTKLFGGLLKEAVADIADEFEAALDADPMVKDKIEFLPHSNPDVDPEFGTVIMRPYAGLWMLDVGLYEIQIKFTLSDNPLGVWTVLAILMASVSFIVAVTPVAVTIFRVMPEIKTGIIGVVGAMSMTTKVVIIGAGVIGVYWLYRKAA